MYSRHALFLIGSQFKNNITKIPWLLNYPICTHWHSVLVFVMDLLKILVYTSLQYLYTHRTHLCINPYNTVLLWQQFVRYPICDATRCDETSLNTGLILLKPPLRTMENIRMRRILFVRVFREAFCNMLPVIPVTVSTSTNTTLINPCKQCHAILL